MEVCLVGEREGGEKREDREVICLAYKEEGRGEKKKGGEICLNEVNTEGE